MPKISGFTVVRDALKQGYPFAESIASALPVCDEFLVSDGYSTDGTYEILQRIASLNPKVRLFRREWSVRSVSVIADLSNELRRECNGDYIFYVQAPEIIHEAAALMLRMLPEIFPNADTFCLPYLTVIANQRVQEEFRLRFARNIDRIALESDGWTFSCSRGFLRNEVRRNILHPRKLLSYVGRGIDWTYAGYLNNNRSTAVYLPKPIFRYPALFKINFIERCRNHAERFNLPDYMKYAKDAENKHGDEFFNQIAVQHRAILKFGYSEKLGDLKTTDHPKIIQEFIRNRKTKDQYDVRQNVIDAIAETRCQE